MSRQEIITALIKLSFDEAAGQRTTKRLEELGQLGIEINKRFDEANHASLSPTSRLVQDLGAKLTVVKNEVQQVSSLFARNEANARLNQLIKAEEKLAAATRKTTEDLREQLGVRDQLANESANTPRERGRLTTIGQTAKFIGREFRINTPSFPVLGTTTDQFGRIIEVAGRIGEAFDGLGNKGRLLSVGLGIAAAGLSVFLAAASAINETFAQQTRAIIDGQEEYYRLRLSGTKEEIENAIEQQRIENEINKARIEENKRLLQAVEQQAGPVGAALADIFNIAGVQELRKATQEAEQALTTGELAMSRYNTILKDQRVQARLAAEAEEELKEKREEAAKAIDRLTERRDDLVERAKQQQERINEDRLIADIRAQEDIDRAKEREEQDHQKRLADIETDGMNRVENIRDQGLKRLSNFDRQTEKVRSKISKADEDFEQKRRKINDEYMRDELRAVEKFRKEEERRTEDYNEERIKLLKKLEEDLLSAQEANDVIAFIQAKRRGEEDLRQLDKDRAIESQRRLDDFLEERRLAELARQERIADAQLALEERKAEIQAELELRKQERAEIEAEIKAAADAEIAGIKERQDLEDQLRRERLQREEEDRILRYRRQEEDRILQDQQRQEDLDRDLARIDEEIEAEKRAAGIIEAAWYQSADGTAKTIDRLFGDLATSLTNKVRNAINSMAIGYSNTGPTLGGAPIPFAEGGIVTKPTIALIGERPGYHEAVIPFRPGQGLSSAIGGMGGPVIQFNGPIELGGITQAQFVDGINKVAATVERAIITARLGGN